MKTKADRISPAAGAPLTEDDWVTLRIENLQPNQVNVKQLRLYRLKITPLTTSVAYADTTPDDVSLRVKIDKVEGRTAEGDIVQAKEIKHGGAGVTATFHDEVEVVPGYTRNITVVHPVPIEQGDPDKLAIFYFVKQMFSNESDVQLSDEEAWRLANQLEWTDEKAASPLNQMNGMFGTFKGAYTLRSFFEYLRLLYGGKHFIVDWMVSNWLPVAEKIARMYVRMPADEGKSLDEMAEDFLRDIWHRVDPGSSPGRGGGFDIHEYIPRKKSAEEQVFESLTTVPTTFMVIGPMPASKNPFQDWLRLLHEVLQDSYSLTENQLYYFEQLAGNEMLVSGLEGLKYDHLLSLKLSLTYFKEDPLHYMRSKGLYTDRKVLEEYAAAGDPEIEEDIRTLVAKINELPEDVIQNYIDEDRDAVSKKLEGTELTIEDLDRFEKEFKFQAVSKAFQMLRKNEELVGEEQDKLKDKENLDAVADIIKSQSKELAEASKLLSKGLQKFRDYMPFALGRRLDAYLQETGLPDTEQLIKKIAAKHNINGEEFKSMIWLYDYRVLGWTNHHFSMLGAVREFIQELLFSYAIGMRNTFISKMYMHTSPANPIDIRPNDMTLASILMDVTVWPFQPYPMDMTREGMELFMSDQYGNLIKAEQMHQTAALNYQEKARYTRNDGEVVTFNILKDLTFNYAYLSQLSRPAIKTEIVSKLDEKKANIDTVRGYLTDDVDYVWEMSGVLDAAMLSVGILPGTRTAMLVTQHATDAEDAKKWTSLGIAALSLVLAIGGFFTGGFTTGIGIALLAGSATLSLIDLGIEYQRHEFGKAVSNTALTQADELGKVEVSWLPVVLAVAGLVIDVVQLAKAVNTIYKVNKLVGTVADNAAEIYLEMEKSLGKGNVLNKAGKPITQKEFVKAFEDAAAKYGPDLVNNKAFKSFAEFHELAPASRPGMYALMKADPEAFELLGKMRGFDTGVLSNIGMQLTLEEKLAASIGETARIFKNAPDSLVKVFNAFGGPNARHMGNLPDLLKLINGSDAARYPELLEIILTDTRYQFKILDNAEMLGKITRRWENYIKTPRTKPFEKFLGTGSTAIRLEAKPRKTIADQFINDAAKLALFASEGNFRAKNLAILGTSEKSLAESIEAGTFVPGNTALRQRLDKILDEDLIGTTTDLQAARNKVVNKINQAIGETVDINQLRKIRADKTPGHMASQGSIFESWVQQNYKSISNSSRKLEGKQTFKNVQGQARESSDITFDDHYLPNDKTFVGVEIKSGDGALAGEELQQSLRYGELARNPALTKTTTHAGYDNVFIEYIFLSENAARKSLKSLLGNIPVDRLKVYYIDNAGKMTLL
jgi:hypothetical protein